MKAPGAGSKQLASRSPPLHWIYTIASYLFFALASPVLLLHPKTREGWARRLGVYPSDFLAHRPKGPGRPRIWLHGASAGDLSALSPMICEFKRRLPGCTVVVTTLTNSGALMARRLSGVDEVSYLPWDLPGATRRAVQAIDPDLLVLEYTELWPHLIRAARRQGARIVLTNGRFSENNLGRYRWLFAVSGRPLASFDLLLMREDEEAERVLGLGAPLDRVWVTGNTKFDALLLEAGNDRPDLAGILDLDAAPVLIAGSTHEGEDLLVIDVWERLLADHPDLQLVIAPRYLERCSKLRGLAEERGFAVRLRSAAGAGPRRDAAGRPAIVVLDSIGELVAAYRLGTLVFVGGSFTDRGGQNILEPAAQGKPVLFGPNMANFHDAVQVLVGRGGIQVNDAAHFYRVAHELLSRPEKIAELGELAQRTVHGIRGASRRNVDHMLRLLGALGEAEAA